MNGMAAFIEQGLKAAQGAVLDVRAQAGLHLEPDSVSRRVRARVRGRLKVIETIVRRLIILMAAALDLPPLPQASPGQTGAAASAPRPALADTVEDVTDTFGTSYGPVHRLNLTGRRTDGLMDWQDAFAGKGAAQTLVAGPVPAAPLIAHIIALQRLLKDPAPTARRLARHLAQMKARQEPRPVCPPSTGNFRLGAELGSVASALPGLVSRAVADWPDTS